MVDAEIVSMMSSRAIRCASVNFTTFGFAISLPHGACPNRLAERLDGETAGSLAPNRLIR
jgi:hypothetical protein